MEALKSKETLKKRSRRKGKNYKSRVKQFYSDFNSDESSDSKNSSSDDGGASVFTFNRARAPKLRPDPESLSQQDLGSLASSSPGYSYGAQGFGGQISPGSYSSYSRLPVSPGLSKNQDVKDVALDLVYQRKIRDLKSNELLSFYAVTQQL